MDATAELIKFASWKVDRDRFSGLARLRVPAICRAEETLTSNPASFADFDGIPFSSRRVSRGGKIIASIISWSDMMLSVILVLKYPSLKTIFNFVR